MWTLYGKSVNLKNFLKSHPGGDLALYLGADRDCTKLFEQYHKNPPSLSFLGISKLQNNDDAFHADLIFAASILKSTKASWFHVFLCTIVGFLTLRCWLGWMLGDVLSMLLVPFLHWLLLANVAHEAGHFAFSNSPFVNESLALISCPIFYNTGHWYLQHNVSHHSETNHYEKDIDLSHYAPFARLHHKMKFTSSLQNIVVCLSFISATFVQSLFAPFDLKHLRKFVGNSTSLMNRTQVTSFAQVSISLMVLIWPFTRFSLLKALIFASYPFAVASIIFMLITQISHIQLDQQQDQGNEHWCKSQVATSLDYSQSSRLVTFLTGGLNCQGLHHCLPFLSSSRFTDFYPTYRAICEKHFVKIHESSGFLHSLSKYIEHLKTLSHDKKQK